MTTYHFDERGHCRASDGSQELSEEEICHRLAEWSCLVDKVQELARTVMYQDVTSKEHMSAYRKRMQPRMDDADRFVALAAAYVTKDGRFATLCANAPLEPVSVDDVRHAVDLARAPCGSTCPDCGCDTSRWIQNHKPTCEYFPL